MSTHTFSDMDTGFAAVAPARSAFSSRILLAGDDAVMLDGLETTLRWAGHEVASTTQGADVFRLVDLLKPDLLITDVIMAEIDVLDAISQLRRSQPDVMIIAVSNNPYLLTLASKQGANFILAKPFGGYQLDLLVRTALQ